MVAFYKKSGNKIKQRYRIDKILAVLLSVCMILTCVNAQFLTTFAEPEETRIQIGEQITAVLNEDGTMVISGSGDTYDFLPVESHPFYVLRSQIKKVEIENGITGLGDYLFYNCTELSGELILPSSILRIGDYVFSGENLEMAPKFTHIINEFTEIEVTKQEPLPEITTEPQTEEVFEEETSEQENVIEDVSEEEETNTGDTAESQEELSSVNESEDSSSVNEVQVTEAEESTSPVNEMQVIEAEEPTSLVNEIQVTEAEEPTSLVNEMQVTEAEEPTSLVNEGQVTEAEEPTSPVNEMQVTEAEELISLVNEVQVTEAEGPTSPVNEGQVTEAEEQPSLVNEHQVTQAEQAPLPAANLMDISESVESSEETAAEILPSSEEASLSTTSEELTTEESTTQNILSRFFSTFVMNVYAEETTELTTQQEVGEEIFYPGQSGLLSVSEENITFREAAEAAGYLTIMSYQDVTFYMWDENEERHETILSLPVTEKGVFLPDYEGSGLPILPEGFSSSGWLDDDTGEWYAFENYAPETVMTLTPEIDNELNYAGDTYVLDVSKGDVRIGANINGYLINGEKVKKERLDTDTIIITGETKTYQIYLDSNASLTVPVILRNVNIDLSATNRAAIEVVATRSTETSGGCVIIELENDTENIVKSGTGRAGIEKSLKRSGDANTNDEARYNTLIIGCTAGITEYTSENNMTTYDHVCTDACGKLEAYGGDADSSYSGPPYMCGAGIGTHSGASNKYTDTEKNDHITNVNELRNLIIAGGNITAVGGKGVSPPDVGGAGIGTGSCEYMQYIGGSIENLNILGGNIIAKGGSGPAACIGGGYRSGYVSLAIYGGDIDATERNGEDSGGMRGTGIGGGGGGKDSGAPAGATVKIYGGTIKAISKHGAAIGAGGAGRLDEANAQPATIEIYGGDITANTIEGGYGAAIGTGGPLGNGNSAKATIKISGGVIKANSVSGADIGGGGTGSTLTTSYAGSADITITGGEIYANNGGIGGGRALVGSGGNATVTISGGIIEAASIGGGFSETGNGGDVSNLSVTGGTLSVSGGIGGGASTSGNGGDATVNVTGGVMKAASIGGGVSVNGNGGAVAELNISGGKLTLTGSVGGGDSTYGNGGTAKVNVSGGTIVADNIGGGKSAATDKYGSADITITGGSLNSGMSAMPKDASGNELHLSLMTVLMNKQRTANALVKQLTIKKLSNGETISYGIHDVWSDGNGILYFWLPEDSLASNAVVNAGAGDITLMAAVKEDDYVLSDGSTVFYTIRFPYDDNYTLYTGIDENNNLINQFTRTCVAVGDEKITLYVKAKDGYNLSIYSGSGTSEVKSMNEYITPIGKNIYKISWYVNSNVDMLVIATNEATGESRMSLDLSLYSVTINQGNTETHNLRLGSYLFDGYKGSYLLTSGKIPTANYLEVNANTELHIDNLTAKGSDSMLRIGDGAKLTATVSNADNSMSSSSAAAVIIEEDSILDLTIKQGNSLRFTSQTGSAIDGSGYVAIHRTGGNLELISGGSNKQITGQILTYDGIPDNGIPYTFQPVQGILVGYHDGNKLISADSIKNQQGTYTSCVILYVLPYGVDTPLYQLTADGALVVTIPDGAHISSLKQNETELILNDGYTVSGNMLTISQSKCSGILEVVFVKDKTITFTTPEENYSKVYDAKEYVFEVKVHEPTGCIVTYSWNKDGGSFTVLTEEQPEFINVGVYTINWTITPSNAEYEIVTGTNTVTITKAKNDWVNRLICPTVLIDHQPNPSAVAKFQKEGEPEYKYFDSNQKELSSLDVSQAGTYYVRAYIAESENYTGLDSQFVQFVISEKFVAVGSGRILQKRQDMEIVSSISVPSNGAVTFYYGMKYTPDDTPLTFTFSEPLPEGTVLTLMDLCDRHNTDWKFYYHTVENSITSIESTEFHTMGLNDEEHNFEEKSDTSIVVEYQLCIDFPEDSTATKDIVVGLNRLNVEMCNEVTVKRIYNAQDPPGTPTGTLKLVDTTVSAGTLSANITVSNISNGGNHILSVSLLDAAGNPVDYPVEYVSSVKLNDELPTAVRRSFAAFAVSGNGTYNFTVTGLKEGTYQLKAALCVPPTDYAYPMYTQIGDFYSLSVVVTKYQPSAITASPDISKRVFDAEGGTINFTISCSGDGTASWAWQSKTNGVYTTINTNVVTNSQASVTIPKNTEPGTYRVLFTYGDAEYPYNIIVE